MRGFLLHREATHAETVRKHEGRARQEKAQEAETRAISERRIMCEVPREDTKRRVRAAAP
ncbi:hypothetical protein COK81_15860 [Bacillus thuringiensis]|uniref:Uncharacterized protein n=1 Tax=Bacillus thuringiensis TaxID=1428 RepID=A0A9X7G1P9_BACTU|nr:hypothetical protein COK81_15860 [Bacillus thuringiensis]